MPLPAFVALTDGVNPIGFTRRDVTAGVATYVSSNGTPIADKRIAIGQTRTPQGRTKTSVKISFPVVQDIVVNGISRPTVVRTAYADLTVTGDGTANTRERQMIREVLANFLSADKFGDELIDNLEYPSN